MRGSLQASGVVTDDTALCLEPDGGLRHLAVHVTLEADAMLSVAIHSAADTYLDVRTACTDESSSLTACVDASGAGGPEVVLTPVPAGGAAVLFGADVLQPPATTFVLAVAPDYGVPWGRSQPNNIGEEDCLLLQLVDDNEPAGSFLDGPCASPLPFLCAVASGVGIGACVAVPEPHAGLDWFVCQAEAWSDARASCESAGGELARVDEVDVSALVSFLPSLPVPVEQLWLGATDSAVEGRWQWLDGTPIPAPPFSAWRFGEPADGGDCAMIDAAVVPDFLAGRAVDCADLRRYVCDVAPGTQGAGCIVANLAGVTRALCEDPRTYSGAEAACAALGGALARIDSADEQTALYDAIDVDFTGDELWIGANDRDFEGLWVWPDGSFIDRF